MWFVWTTAALAAPCTLHRVAPADAHALTSSGVPRNALVRSTVAGDCADGVQVDILATDPVYPSPETTTPVCVPSADLAPVHGLRWVVPAAWNTDTSTPHPHLAGLILDPLPASVDCTAQALPFGDLERTLADLGPLRPVSSATLDAVLAIQAHAIQRFGPVALTDILWTDGGRVSLPWVRWDTEAELADTFAREHFDSEARQERAVRGHGPGGHYLYFKGADPIRSDVWGTPDTIHALLDTVADWQAVCSALRPEASSTCAVQLGDISWYSAKRPDPLGHRDHYRGTCVDVRLFRDDGSRYEAYWNRADDRPQLADQPGYSAELTGAFIDHLLARADVHRVLFNDPSIAAATPAKGHDDHLHVCFEPKATGQ